MKQKVTLSIEKDIYKKFQQFCEDNAVMLSKKVEIWMSQEMEHFRDARGKRLCAKKEMEDAKKSK